MDIKIIQFVPEQNEKDFMSLFSAFMVIWNAAENQKFLSLTKQPFDKTIIRSWLRKHIRKGICYFCAVNGDNKIVAISVIQEQLQTGYRLLAMGVHPEYKHKGIGFQLIEHSISFGVQKGYHAVDTSVFADNIRMLRLLLKAGFIPTEIHHGRRYDGADVVCMKYMYIQ